MTKQKNKAVRKKEQPSEGQQPGNGTNRNIMIWVLVLLVIPMMLFMLRGKDENTLDELKSSQFEKLLTAHKIASVQVEEQSNTSIQKLTGEYWPEAAEAGDSNGLRNYTVKVIYSDALDALIRQHCQVRTVKQTNSIWTGLLYSTLPFLLIALFFYIFFIRQMRNVNGSAFKFGQSRARRMQPGEGKITMKDVAGISEAKEDMQEIVDYLKDPKKFRRLGGRIPRGVLMVGPPGTGKTLLAKAIAGEAGVPFFSISGSDFVEMFVGVGASRVRDMFEEGKKNSPCLIFIDEIDAVGRSRFAGIGGGNDEREQTLNALLVEMDGFEPNSGVIVLAATNRPDVLDKALMRPGRFDRQIVIDLPDQKGRYDILKIHAKKVKLDKNVDLKDIARGTSGFSGADLANLMNEAAILATRADKKAIDIRDLEEARDKVCFGKERRSRKMTEAQRKLTAYHEAGHTMVNLYCEHTEPLHKVTIIPRGMALGATMFLPETDRYNITENEAYDMMAMGMGGRCAEKLVFNELTSGGSQDIRQATAMAKRMVCEWGMSPRMGALSYSSKEEHIYLGRDITRSEGVSQETARMIDEEIRRLIDAAENRATEILTVHRDQLNMLAEALLLRETMTAEEVYELLGMEPRKMSDEGFGGEGEKEEPEEEPEEDEAAEEPLPEE